VVVEIEKAFSKTPKDFGFNRSRWEGVVVAEYLKRYHSAEIHVRHAPRLIKKLGHTMRRFAYEYARALASGVKEFHEDFKKLLPALANNGQRVILFEDEAGFSLHPALGRIFGKKGEKYYVITTSKHHKRLNLFGWVDPLNGWHATMK
jgi:hypothetical protein